MHIIEGGIFEEITHLSLEDLTHSICQVQEGFEEVFSIGKMATISAWTLTFEMQCTLLGAASRHMSTILLTPQSQQADLL